MKDDLTSSADARFVALIGCRTQYPPPQLIIRYSGRPFSFQDAFISQLLWDPLNWRLDDHIHVFLTMQACAINSHMSEDMPPLVVSLGTTSHTIGSATMNVRYWLAWDRLALMERL